MRKPFDFNNLVTDGYTMLVHGIWASGKTHFLGDMLATEAKAGPVKFLNIAGEDGAASAKGSNLPTGVGETLETYQDFTDFCREFAGKKLQAVGLDSMSVLARVVARAVVGADRMPKISKDSNEWGDFHREMQNATTLLRNTAKYVLCVCPSDRSTENVSQQVYITPDLPGRQAAGSGGWFDFVGYLSVRVLGPASVKRILTFKPSGAVIVRQRIRRMIMDEIELPEGAGGWSKVKQIIADHDKPLS